MDGASVATVRSSKARERFDHSGAEGTHKRRLRETARDTLFVKPL